MQTPNIITQSLAPVNTTKNTPSKSEEKPNTSFDSVLNQEVNNSQKRTADAAPAQKPTDSTVEPGVPPKSNNASTNTSNDNAEQNSEDTGASVSTNTVPVLFDYFEKIGLLGKKNSANSKDKNQEDQLAAGDLSQSSSANSNGLQLISISGQTNSVNAKDGANLTEIKTDTESAAAIGLATSIDNAATTVDIKSALVSKAATNTKSVNDKKSFADVKSTIKEKPTTTTDSVVDSKSVIAPNPTIGNDAPIDTKSNSTAKPVVENNAVIENQPVTDIKSILKNSNAVSAPLTLGNKQNRSDTDSTTNEISSASKISAPLPKSSLKIETAAKIAVPSSNLNASDNTTDGTQEVIDQAPPIAPADSEQGQNAVVVVKDDTSTEHIKSPQDLSASSTENTTVQIKPELTPASQEVALTSNGLVKNPVNAGNNVSMINDANDKRVPGQTQEVKPIAVTESKSAAETQKTIAATDATGLRSKTENTVVDSSNVKQTTSTEDKSLITNKFETTLKGQISQQESKPVKLEDKISTTTVVEASPAQQNVMLAEQVKATIAPNQIAPYVGKSGWDQALGQKIVWMVAGGEQTAQLSLNPPDLGPLQVVLSINDSHVDASFVSAHLDVREAIEAAAPKLREMMDSAGIQLSGFSVSSQSAGSQNPAPENRAYSAGIFKPDSSSDSITTGSLLNKQVRINSKPGGVDTFA